MAALLQTCAQITFVISLALHSSYSQTTPNTTLGNLYCYQCNSGTAFDGQPCADISQSKGNPTYLKACPVQDMHGNNFNHCRKIVQSVQDNLGNWYNSVVRSCTTVGTSSSGYCMDKVGTARVTMKYCDCYNTAQDTVNRTPCNSSPNQNAACVSLVMTSVLYAIWAVVKAI